MVLVQDIELYSLCEHHLLPFVGRCHVAYLPQGKVLGLSKVARIVDMFARRLQIQEQLTLQTAESIREVTGADGVGVISAHVSDCRSVQGASQPSLQWAHRDDMAVYNGCSSSLWHTPTTL